MTDRAFFLEEYFSFGSIAFEREGLSIAVNHGTPIGVADRFENGGDTCLDGLVFDGS